MMTATNPTGEYLAMPLEDQGPKWRRVSWPGIDDYEISDRGYVKRIGTNKTLKPHFLSGHIWVSLRDTTGFTLSVRVDRLVLSTFVGYEERLMPEHADGEYNNCRLDNLSWREPTPEEQAIAKAVANRKANALIKAKTPAKKAPAKKKTAAKAPAGYKVSRGKIVPDTKPRSKLPPRDREVTMTRTYGVDGLRVEVTPEGGILEGGLPQGPLSPSEVISLAAILAKIAEFNVLIGAAR